MAPSLITRLDSIELTRRLFLIGLGATAASSWTGRVGFASEATALPVGTAPVALKSEWFPSRLHAFVWRNWSLVPAERMAEVLGTDSDAVTELGRAMGLTPGGELNDQERERATLTIIRRNWHLLPYEQLLALLGWSADQMAYALREDDFLYHKLGLLKPTVSALRWEPPDAAQQARSAEIRNVVARAFPNEPLLGRQRSFEFVKMLSQPMASDRAPATHPDPAAPLRMGYSYFALYGDPLIDPRLDPYPDAYLARLAAVGINAVWLQGVLGRLAELPWAIEAGIQQRRENLRALVDRAARHGIRVFLYLNEPRALPSGSATVFQQHPEWRGVAEHDHIAVCTSSNEVRAALRGAIAELCRAVPGLGGFFTITASENLTNCWSHGAGGGCPRCAARGPAEVIAELNSVFLDGIREARGRHQLIAWDWGWANSWAVDAIERLPSGVSLMSVSEWDVPIERGGVETTVGEYSLSVDRTGPRAARHWAAARRCGLGVVAKLQLGVTWEFAAAPYLPVLENIERHVGALLKDGVHDFMLGWTLGGHPSPNLELVKELASGGTLDSLAVRCHGEAAAPIVVAFWRECSAAFREFPYHGGTVYMAPLQMGPANPLWPRATGYRACMVGIPYDDLESWRSVYPADRFIEQLERVARGLEAAVMVVRQAIDEPAAELEGELRYAEAAAIHFASVANQSRFVLTRSTNDSQTQRQLANDEARLAARLHRLRSADSRLGFEASNQYFFTPLDLVEKVVNCDWLVTRVLAADPIGASSMP